MDTALIVRLLKLLLVIGLAALVLPICIIGFLVITSDQESVAISLDTTSVVDMIIIAIYLFLLATLATGGIYWFVTQVRSLINLRNEKMRMELLHLQSQINPHFFFNVLNNLYGLVEKDASKAKDMILNLSNMMRYSIYEGQKDQVTLREEVDYLQKFINLNQSRYRKKIDVAFETTMKDEQIKVTPLLFIILLENAFKHGVEHLTKGAYVHISLKSEGHIVHFEIANNFDPEELSDQPGVGLANLQRRLELVYPKTHALNIDQQASDYHVSLTLHTT